MKRTVVLDVVGMTPALMRHAPNLTRLAARGAQHLITTVLPAVTTTVQSMLVTGTLPRTHGVVANGWYFRDTAEVWLWRQSNHLVHGEKVRDAAKRRDPDFTCAKLFWWYNMYATADHTVTPRPMYPADGRKLPDIYTQPAALRDELKGRFGQFPLFRFRGAAADIVSSRWIPDRALHMLATRQPTLTLVYLPHHLQRLGPDHPAIARDVAEVDALCGELIEAADRIGAHVVVLSEFGIAGVSRPVHINRALHRAGLLKVRDELGRDQFDAGASDTSSTTRAPPTTPAPSTFTASPATTRWSCSWNRPSRSGKWRSRVGWRRRRSGSATSWT